MARVVASIERHGFGFWVVEQSEGQCAFVGFAGLLRACPSTPISRPRVEVGWRLAAIGLGKEATPPKRAARRFAFAFRTVFRLDEVVSMAVVDNLPSRRVMERLDMTRRPEDDFGHPNSPSIIRFDPMSSTGYPARSGQRAIKRVHWGRPAAMRSCHRPAPMRRRGRLIRYRIRLLPGEARHRQRRVGHPR